MSRSIAWLQKAACEAGYYSGPMDGQASPALDIAIGRWRLNRWQPLDPAKPFNGLVTQPENSGS